MPPRRGRDDSDSDGEYLPKMSGRRRPKSVVNEADDEDRVSELNDFFPVKVHTKNEVQKPLDVHVANCYTY